MKSQNHEYPSPVDDLLNFNGGGGGPNPDLSDNES